MALLLSEPSAGAAAYAVFLFKAWDKEGNLLAAIKDANVVGSYSKYRFP